MTNLDELEKLGISKSLAKEVLDSGVEGIFLRSDLIPAATYFNFGKIILLRSLNSYELKTGAAEVSSEQGIDLLPSELPVWLICHEWGHHRGLTEKEANTFASKEVSRRRGYTRKFTIMIDVEGIVRRVVREAFSR